MRTHVAFRSGAFPRGVDDDDEVDPGRVGKSVSLWVKQELAAGGFAMGPVVAEDWGWLVLVEAGPLPARIGCGSDDEHEDGWLCSLHPQVPTIRRGFRKVDGTEVLERLASELDAALRAHPSVHSVRWWSDDEVSRG